MADHSDEAMAWLRAYSGSIDATALLLAFDAGQRAVRAEVEAESADLIDPEHAICGIWGCTYLRHRRGSSHSWETQERTRKEPRGER